MSEEDDDEMLYREMNPDDGFYMGNQDNKNDSASPNPRNRPESKTPGCAIFFVAIIIIIAVVWVLFY